MLITVDVITSVPRRYSVTRALVILATLYNKMGIHALVSLEAVSYTAIIVLWYGSCWGISERRGNKLFLGAIYSSVLLHWISVRQ